jgi:bromodomain-containing factor 1
MERHLKTLSEKIRLMKAATKKKEKVEKKPPVKPAPQEKPVKPKAAAKTPVKAPPKPAPAKAPAPEKKKAPPKRSRPVYSSSSGSSSSSEDDVPMITFEQKKELSDSINNFEGDKLANVVQIIHSRMPHLRDVSRLFLRYLIWLLIKLSSFGVAKLTFCYLAMFLMIRMVARRRSSWTWTR